MDSSRRHQKLVSVVIPALNEEGTVGSIVQVARLHPEVREVIVVDDGSTDQTSVMAETSGAKVISLFSNLGKAQAMQHGVDHAQAPVIVFLDADLLGFSLPMLNRLIHQVRSGNFDMFALTQDYGNPWFNAAAGWAPLLSGIRALRRELWSVVPERYKRFYQIEVALNFFAKRSGYRVGSEVMPGLRQVIKERKRGWVWGLYQRIFMMRDVILVVISLHFFWSFAHVWNLYLRRPLWRWWRQLLY